MTNSHRIQINTPQEFIAFGSEAPVISKINGLGDLQAGWCYGRGVCFGPGVLRDAKQIVRLFHAQSVFLTDVFPGEDGEIMVAAYQSSSCCEVIIYGAGRYDGIIEVADKEERREENIDFKTIDRLIRDFKELLVCISLGRSIPGILTKHDGGMSAWHSKTPVREAFPLYNIAASF